MENKLGPLEQTLNLSKANVSMLFSEILNQIQDLQESQLISSGISENLIHDFDYTCDMFGVLDFYFHFQKIHFSEIVKKSQFTSPNKEEIS